MATDILTVRQINASSTTEIQGKPLEKDEIRSVYGEVFPAQIHVEVADITGLVDFSPIDKPATPDHILVGTLPIDTIKLKQPITVSIKREDDQFIAYYSPVDEYGFGNSPMQAVDDLRLTIIELYTTLKEEKDMLGTGLADTLKHLEEIIEE